MKLISLIEDIKNTVHNGDIKFKDVLSFFVGILSLVIGSFYINYFLSNNIRLDKIPENMFIVLMTDLLFFSFCLVIYVTIIYFQKVIFAISLINVKLDTVNDMNVKLSLQISQR